MRKDSLTIGWQSDWAFASSARFGWWQHRPPLLNYSLGNAIIRHKGLSFASALWKPGDINCRGSLPSPFLPPSWEFSTAPAAHIQHFHPHPPRSPRIPLLQTGAPNIPRITYSALIRFCPVCWQQSTPRFRYSPPPPLSCSLCKLVAQAAASKHFCVRRTQPQKSV